MFTQEEYVQGVLELRRQGWSSSLERLRREEQSATGL
jgi:hypothetical protein